MTALGRTETEQVFFSGVYYDRARFYKKIKYILSNLDMRVTESSLAVTYLTSRMLHCKTWHPCFLYIKYKATNKALVRDAGENSPTSHS